MASRLLAFISPQFLSTLSLERAYVPDLFTNEMCRSCLVLPLSQEQLAQEWIQRLFLTSQLVAPATVLLLQRTEEPLQDEQCPFSRIIFLACRCDKDGGVFSPVGGEFDERRRGEDERGRGHGGEVTVERGDGLYKTKIYVSLIRLSRKVLNMAPSSHTFRNEDHDPFAPGGTAEPSSALLLAMMVEICTRREQNGQKSVNIQVKGRQRAGVSFQSVRESTVVPPGLLGRLPVGEEKGRQPGAWCWEFGAWSRRVLSPSRFASPLALRRHGGSICLDHAGVTRVANPPSPCLLALKSAPISSKTSGLYYWYCIVFSLVSRRNAKRAMRLQTLYCSAHGAASCARCPSPMRSMGINYSIRCSSYGRPGSM